MNISNNWLNPGGVSLLKTALDLFRDRQAVIASNVANLDTPGYKAKRLDFQSSLRAAVEAERSDGPLPSGKLEVNPILSEVEGPAGPDGNTVSLEREMALMNKNDVLYKSSVELISKELDLLAAAVSGDVR